MSRELWLLRHSKAEHHDNLADHDRRLTAKGEQKALRIGQWFQHAHLSPDVLLSSPAARAYRTACIIADTLAWDESSIQQDKRLYFQGIDAIKSLLAEFPASIKKVLVVGHNPDFEDLLVNLVGEGKLAYEGELMPTAALVRLQLLDDWRSLETGCGKVLERVVV